MIRATVSLVLVFLCLSPGSVNIASAQLHMTDIKVLQTGGGGQCPSMEEREREQKSIRQLAIHSAIRPFTCNGTSGWRRVAFVNMTDTSYNCPTGLNLTSYSKRTCGRSHTTAGECSSTTFSVEGLQYRRVCGRIRGYQFGSTGAFAASSVGIDSYYVGGISLTLGSAGNHQHIWTFAAGISEATDLPYLGCPCDNNTDNLVPSFVGNDYFCESGLNVAWNYNYTLYSDDVLWDGSNCITSSTCCQLNNPPWFAKNLPSATTEDIELRICAQSLYEDIPFELVEVYVQ